MLSKNDLKFGLKRLRNLHLFIRQNISRINSINAIYSIGEKLKTDVQNAI